MNEGHIQNSPYLAKHIPRGELIDLLGKALLYLEVEAHWRADAITTDCKVGFSLLEPHICSSDATTMTTMKTHAPPSNAHATVAASASMPQPRASSSSIPPPSASAKVTPNASKPHSSASQNQPSQASPIEAGNKRKSSPVAVDVPTEKRQRIEPQASTSQSVIGTYVRFSPSPSPDLVPRDKLKKWTACKT